MAIVLISRLFLKADYKGQLVYKRLFLLTFKHEFKQTFKRYLSNPFKLFVFNLREMILNCFCNPKGNPSWGSKKGKIGKGKDRTVGIPNRATQGMRFRKDGVPLGKGGDASHGKIGNMPHQARDPKGNQQRPCWLLFGFFFCVCLKIAFLEGNIMGSIISRYFP